MSYSKYHCSKSPFKVEDPEKKGKTVNEVTDVETAARWLENDASGKITLKAIEKKKLQQTINEAG